MPPTNPNPLDPAWGKVRFDSGAVGPSKDKVTHPSSGFGSLLLVAWTSHWDRPQFPERLNGSLARGWVVVWEKYAEPTSFVSQTKTCTFIGVRKQDTVDNTHDDR